jgi:murein DD-endopeptidase MepM/ murein hydrolase activator NlpD
MLLVVVLALLFAAPAAGDVGTRKQAVDSQLAGLHQQIAAAQAHEGVLSSEIAAVTGEIRGLEARVGDVSTRLTSLQRDLALQQSRLGKLTALFILETRQLRFYERQYSLALHRLNALLVHIYDYGRQTTLEIILSATSLQDLLDRIDYTAVIARTDKSIATQFLDARNQAHLALIRVAKVKTTVAAAARVIGYRVHQQELLRNQLLASTNAAGATLDQKQHDLTSTRQQEGVWVSEANALAGVSSRLAAEIQAAQATPSGVTPTTGQPLSGVAAASSAGASGLIWPVDGPITSPFGMRWGTLHPGIDIGVPMGTPIAAAASGRVIVAGYDGGYGNLVVIDNGNGIATAYAHQSSIAVTVGQDVSQGQVIGYVGSTGFSTGPHLHFEVRVDGSPVDPLGYL